MKFYDKIEIKKHSICIEDPFFIFENKDFLDNSLYHDLNDDFPNKKIFPKKYNDHGGKQYLNNSNIEFSKFLTETPVWNDFLQNFLKEDCINKFYKISQIAKTERSHYQRKPWRLEVNAVNFKRQRFKFIRRLIGRLLGYTPVVVKFEFSYLENSCWIPPHTDVDGKLISLMLYFPDDNVDYKGEAGTQFYRGKDGKPAPSAWKVEMLDKSAAESFYKRNESFHTSYFEKNLLVGFVKSAISWHGVGELKIPPGASRRSLNINYYLL